MSVDPSRKIRECLARAAALRRRAQDEADPAGKSFLDDLAYQWQAAGESYELLDDAGRFLNKIRARRYTTAKNLACPGDANLQPNRPVEISHPVNGTSLAELLGVLVRVAIEHTDGKARAAFYLADPAGTELHHVIGMPEAYARCVDGFAISKDSLACGLAVATRKGIITPDVSEEPRWKEWLWLAEEYRYRACWSFPVATPSDKVLGSFAMYYENRREATPRDLDVASVLTRTAATIISCH